MKPMQRQFGKLMKKGPGDTANVAVLLSDYEDADKMLTKVPISAPDRPTILTTL